MSVISPRSALAAALAAALLSACATTEQGQAEVSAVPGPMAAPAPAPAGGALLPGAGTLTPAVPTPPTMGTQRYPRTIQDSGTGAAAMSLYRKAQDALAGNHVEQADELLDRARRIEPHNPFLLQAIANTKLKLNQPDQAEEFANLSNKMARGNPYVEYSNWVLIATARQKQGNSNGAVQAQNRADDLSRVIVP